MICEANHILAKQVDHTVSREEQKRSRKNIPIITKYENTLPLIFRCAMLASLKSCLRFSHSLNPCFQDFTTLVLYCFRLLQLCHKTLSKTKTKKKKKTKTGTGQECQSSAFTRTNFWVCFTVTSLSIGKESEFQGKLKLKNQIQAKFTELMKLSTLLRTEGRARGGLTRNLGQSKECKKTSRKLQGVPKKCTFFFCLISV